MIEVGVEWKYQTDEIDLKLWIFKKYRALDALYEAIVMYHQKRGKFPLNKSREFVSKVISFWVSVSPLIKTKREEAVKLSEMKNLKEKLLKAIQMYYDIGDRLKKEGILDLKRYPRMGVKQKAEGMIFGYG